MSAARDLVYAFINKQIEKGEPVEPGSDGDLYLHGLLNRVEDDRVHREAEKLRSLIGEAGRVNGPGLTVAADKTDPYTRIGPFDREIDEVHPDEEKLNPDCAQCREGAEHLHRKRDGKPVTL
jgi:hypothetical protein